MNGLLWPGNLLSVLLGGLLSTGLFPSSLLVCVDSFFLHTLIHHFFLHTLIHHFFLHTLIHHNPHCKPWAEDAEPSGLARRLPPHLDIDARENEPWRDTAPPVLRGRSRLASRSSPLNNWPLKFVEFGVVVTWLEG